MQLICKWLHAVFIYVLSNDIKQRRQRVDPGGGVDQRVCCLCLITDLYIDEQNRCSLILTEMSSSLCLDQSFIEHHSFLVSQCTQLPNTLVLCFYFHLPPSISLSLPVRCSFSTWVGPVNARILTAQRKNRGEALGAMGGEQKACQCPGRVLDFGIHLSLSSTLPGTDGSGQWQPVTDD